MIAALMNHLWQSTLFAIAAAITAAALRKNGAHIRHGVWVIASLKFLAPFSLLMSLGADLVTFTPVAAVSRADRRQLRPLCRSRPTASRSRSRVTTSCRRPPCAQRHRQ